MENKQNIQTWLNTAVSSVRFKPDRAAVEEELRGHFEDKVADLQRMYHLDQDEAEEMALGQMGNAEEIGREMAKIHKPWLGYLWRLSQWMLGLTIVLWLLSCLWSGSDSVLRSREVTEWPKFSCEDVLELGQYKFRVKEAWLERLDDGEWELNVKWKVTGLRFWEPVGHVQSYFWSAEDDQGNQYCRYFDHFYHVTDRLHVNSSYAEKDGVGWLVEQMIPNVPEEVQWVKVSYDHADVTGTVLLEREVTQ